LSELHGVVLGLYYSAFFSEDCAAVSYHGCLPPLVAGLGTKIMSLPSGREFGGLQDGGRPSARAAGDLRGLRPRRRPPCVLRRHHHHHRLPPQLRHLRGVELQLEHGLGLAAPAAAAAPPRLKHVGAAALAPSERNKQPRNRLPLPPTGANLAGYSVTPPSVAALQCRAQKKPPGRVTPPSWASRCDAAVWGAGG